MHDENPKGEEMPASDTARQMMADYKYIRDQIGEDEDPMPILELVVLESKKFSLNNH